MRDFISRLSNVIAWLRFLIKLVNGVFRGVHKGII